MKYMPRKEGSLTPGEKLSRPAEHRAAGMELDVKDGLRILEKQFGPEVVSDDPVRANEVRQEALRKRLAATANHQLTPEELRSARQQEYQAPYAPEQTVPFSPLSSMVDMPENQPPTPSQSMYASGGPQ